MARNVSIIASRRNFGFTIVELLIVIIIIGILATLTLVAYNQVTTQANNTKTLHYAQQWENAIQTYRVVHSVYPNDWTCLGNNVSNFPSDSSLGLGVCEQNLFSSVSGRSSEYKTSPTPGQTESTPQLLADSQTVANGTLPEYTSGSAVVRGIVYAVDTDPTDAPNGQPGAYILYALYNQTCPNGQEYKVVSKLHACAIKLTDANYSTEIFDPINPIY